MIENYNLKNLIELRNHIDFKISNILENEIEQVRKKYNGNGHTIENIEINNDDSITITVWYDDWETSQRAYHRFKDIY